jgi:hypothetical protein|tara:strand:- start:389 stop:802 length:414 start_codon:yes stop_codon:yes gene_type:complete
MKWIICFCESKNIGIWKYFTKHRIGFSHVYAVNYDVELDLWKKIEFTTNGLVFHTLKGQKATELVLNMHLGGECVEIDVKDKPIYMPRLFYCVSFIKHLCNVRKFWILTPYQLYCELRRLNGKVIFEANDLLEQPNG